MRRAALIFNPHAGRGGRPRQAAPASAAAALRANGIGAEIVYTHAAGTAGAQALDAANDGVSLFFACGGDGTLHEVIQGLAFHPSAVVGMIPLGSANALARHLGLSFNAADAVRQQLTFVPRRIPLGRVSCETPSGTQSRYFAVMAGAGPDGALVYRMLASGKHRLGRSVYYMRAAKLFLASRFATFHVIAEQLGLDPLERDAVSAMAVRVGDLGGLFSPLIRGASPADETLRLALTQPPSHLALPAWFAASWARLHRWNPYTQHLNVSSFTCSAGSPHRVHVQADGEWIGTTPMQVEIVPNALMLLMPASPLTSPPAR
ncbi:MAG TPA: diacylglycerol kinase family protein [Candidatus Aquilonibacter sp.]|nr:diacylglycerol kinase family protein [Candidatus Aquilonibacter sp.]